MKKIKKAQALLARAIGYIMILFSFMYLAYIMNKSMISAITAMSSLNAR